MARSNGTRSQDKVPKLLEQVREVIRTRHYSLRTEGTYLGWIRRFILFHGKRHPREMGRQEVQQFLSHLAVEGHVAASTQSQALSAIMFLYQQVLKQDIGWLNQSTGDSYTRHRRHVDTTRSHVPSSVPMSCGSI
jgi:site-specific recombinase XerD